MNKLVINAIKNLLIVSLSENNPGIEDIGNTPISEILPANDIWHIHISLKVTLNIDVSEKEIGSYTLDDLIKKIENI